MSNKIWFITLGITLIITSAAVYILQIFVFDKSNDTFFYMLQDLAFVPIQVLLVMLIIDKLLQKKEKQNLFNKLNMLIGVFYNEVGTELISQLNSFISEIDQINDRVDIKANWKRQKFKESKKFLQQYNPEIIFNIEKISSIKKFLLNERSNMLKMLQNPNLLEHEAFTDLLWAVFHLTYELDHRESFSDLPESDINHLKIDTLRAYKFLIVQWLYYMEHLRESYPYLFSIAMRTNPFVEKNVVIE